MINEDSPADSFYFNSTRTEIERLLGSKTGVIVDVGCGSGTLLSKLAKRPGTYAIGIEGRREVADQLRQSGHVNEVFQLNVECDHVPVQEGSVDVLIMSHILEHFADPKSVLERLRKLLKPDGVLVGAVPNVQHVRVIYDLVLRGEWEYSEAGILDKTHLRFFTRRSLGRFLLDCGFSIEQMDLELGSDTARWLSRLSLGMLNSYWGYAINFRCSLFQAG